MSEYGKKWEDIRLIREEIKRLVPTANTDSFHSASNSLESFKALLDVLMMRWEVLEAEIKEMQEE
jgi:hypothetical protein